MLGSHHTEDQARLPAAHSTTTLRLTTATTVMHREAVRWGTGPALGSQSEVKHH